MWYKRSSSFLVLLKPRQIVSVGHPEEPLLLIYEADDGMSCDIEQDTLPAEAPEVVYAMLGRLRQVEQTDRS